MFNFLSKKPKVWVVTDGKDSCVQSWAIARYITEEKNITEYDRLNAHSAKSGFPDLAIGVGSGVTETLEGIKEVSKGKTKIAVILDPLKDYDIFDFIILPSYEPYHIEGDGVIRTIGLTNYINDNFLKLAKNEYKKHKKFKFLRDNKDIKNPVTSVLIGGRHTGGNVSINDAKNIIDYTNQIVSTNGGCALITTSARTEVITADYIKANIKVPHFIYDYKVRETENPYDIFLSLADNIIVTGDSVRMMCEACSTGKQVSIYKPEELGFQYDALIDELVEGGYANIMGNELNSEFSTLNEAQKVANIIKDRL